MWEALHEIVAEQGMNVNQLVTRISRRARESSLTSAIRIYIVEFYRSAARPLDAFTPRSFANPGSARIASRSVGASCERLRKVS